MVCLEKNLPHKKKHLYLLQKKGNSIIPHRVVIKKVAHINTEIALIPAAGTISHQIEECGGRS